MGALGAAIRAYPLGNFSGNRFRPPSVTPEVHARLRTAAQAGRSGVARYGGSGCGVIAAPAAAP